MGEPAPIPFYTPDSLARLLGVTPKTVWNWVRKGRLPRPEELHERGHFWPAERLDDFFADIRWNVAT